MIRPSRKLAALGFVLGALIGATASADPPAGSKAPEGTGHAAKAPGATGKPEAKAEKAEAKAEAKAEKAEAKTDKPGAAAEKAEPGKPAEVGSAADSMRANKGAFRSEVRELREEIKAGKVKKEEVKARLDQLSQNRKERQQRHREALKERWGDRLTNSAAISELRHHERRIAMLDRALLLAQTDATIKNKDKLITRIESLIEKENARHERKMDQFKSASTPGTAPGVVGASAPAQPNPNAPTVPAQAPAQAPAGGVK